MSWINQFIAKKVLEGVLKKIRKDDKIMKFLENKKGFICWGVVLLNTAVQILNATGLVQIPVPEITYQIIDAVFVTLGIGSRIDTQIRMNALLKKAVGEK